MCISHSAAESVARIRSEHVCAHECHEVMATFGLEFGFGLGFGFGFGFVRVSTQMYHAPVEHRVAHAVAVGRHRREAAEERRVPTLEVEMT